MAVSGSLTNVELFERAGKGGSLSAEEALAVYGDPGNWNFNNELRVWVWIGLVICPFELAGWVKRPA